MFCSSTREELATVREDKFVKEGVTFDDVLLIPVISAGMDSLRQFSKCLNLLSRNEFNVRL